MSIQAMKQALEAIQIASLRCVSEAETCTVLAANAALRAAITEAERTVKIGDKTYVQQGGYLMGEAEKQEPVCYLREEWMEYVQSSEADPHAFPVFTTPQPAISSEMIAAARDALDNLDDYSRMADIDPIGPITVIEELINRLAAAPKPEEMK